MLVIYLEYSIQSETWTWIFQEYARYISNKIWNISHTRWLVSQLVLKGKMEGKCPCCTATWLMGVIHFMTITRQESYRKCYITSFNLLLQKRTSERFHGKEGFYIASLRFFLFWTASLRISFESLWNSQESYQNWFQQFQRSEALHSV